VLTGTLLLLPLLLLLLLFWLLLPLFWLLLPLRLLLLFLVVSLLFLSLPLPLLQLPLPLLMLSVHLSRCFPLVVPGRHLLRPRPAALRPLHARQRRVQGPLAQLGRRQRGRLLVLGVSHVGGFRASCCALKLRRRRPVATDAAAALARA
jgi:hypothetical protein